MVRGGVWERAPKARTVYCYSNSRDSRSGTQIPSYSCLPRRVKRQGKVKDRAERVEWTNERRNAR